MLGRCCAALFLVGHTFSAANAEKSVSKGVLGLGLMVGEPTGVSAKYYLADDHALDVGVGFSLLDDGIQVHADYLWHPWILETRKEFVLPAYVGIGARVLDEAQSEFHLGPRAVIGLVFDFKELPIDAFAEAAGILDFRFGDESGVGIDLNLAMGARYYF